MAHFAFALSPVSIVTTAWVLDVPLKFTFATSKAVMTDQNRITLAHISDVHLPFSNWAPWRYWNMKRRMGLLNWWRLRQFVHRFDALDPLLADLIAQQPDHTAITGDLVNLGLPSQYKKALTWLEAIGPPERVSVVPGNHDIYSTLKPDDPDCGAVWSAYMGSDRYGRNALRDDAASQFPYVRKVGPVVLVGVNSAVPTPPFVAQGEVGGDQRARLKRVLDAVAGGDAFVCVLIHHPPLPDQAPPRRALRDADALEEILSEASVSLVLHGHNHRDMAAWVDGLNGSTNPTPVFGAASGSAFRHHGIEPLARYYLYEFRRYDDEIAIDRITRGLTPDRTEIAELERTPIYPVPETAPQSG